MADMKSLDESLDVAIKFEEYEDRLQAKSSNALPFTVYPPSVLSIQNVPRTHRTGKPSVPEGLAADSPHMKDLLHVFTTNWSVVNKSTYPPVAQPPKEPELVDQIFEIDQTARTGSSQASLDHELLQGVTPKSRQAHKARRTMYDRQPLFKALPLIPPPAPDRPHPGNAFAPIHAFQFHVRAITMSMHLGDVEPFYGELFVYDLANKESVSERYHFDCNADGISQMVPQNSREPRDNIAKSKQAIFRVSNPSPNLYLVLHITKTIRGDPDDTTEMYFKVQTVKQKEKNKFMQETKEAVGRLGALRQSFAWGAIQLFSPTGQPCIPLNQHLKLNNIARAKGDLASYVSKVNDDREVKKMRLVPCDCTFEISLLETDIPNRLDPSLIPVLPTTDKSTDIIREIQEFDTESAPPQPFTSYVHHLYFYPRTLNFNNYKSDKSSKARNLCCEVKFLEDDTNVNAPGQQCIYGTSTTASVARSGWSTVVYHNKKPKWTDEIKVRLPPVLKPQNHLLVTFYHVSCRAGKKQAESMTPLGYCAIRLVSAGGEIIVDDKYNVPVASVFPPKYFDLEHRENLLRWVDNKKGVFTYKTRLVSTIAPQDQTLHSLFTSLSTDPTILQQQLIEVREISPRVRVQYMATLITTLLRVVCDVSRVGFNRVRSASVTPGSGSVHIRVESPTTEQHSPRNDNNLQKEEIIRSNPAVESMLTLLDTVEVIHRQTADLEYLESYVTYLYSNESNLDGLHAAIVSIWIFLLDEKNECANELAKFSWFLFRLISKSMVLELRNIGKLNTDSTRKGRFSDFMAQLYLLTGLLASETQKLTRSSLILARSFNNNIAHFLSDILDIGDRGEVFRLIDLYVRKLDPKNETFELVDMKFSFLRVLSFHEFYIALNVVVPPVIPPVSDIYSVFFGRHFLVGLLLAEVGSCIRAREKDMQLKAIVTLRDQLYRHEHNPHLQDPVLKERLAAIYFPFLPLVLDNWTILQKIPLPDIKDWLICFLYILKGIGLNVQSEWLKKETPQRKLSLFDLLTQCVKTFEYKGREESKHIITQLRHSSTHYYSGLGETLSHDLQHRPHSRKEIKSAIFRHKSKHSQGSQGSQGGGPRESTKQILESYYSNSPGNSSPASTTSSSSPHGSSSGSGVKKRTKSTASITSPPISPIPLNLNGFNEDPVHVAKMSANLSTEVSMIVLSTLMQYFGDHLQDLTRSTTDFLEASFNTLVTLLRTNQSQTFLTLLFSTLPEVIEDFKMPLFKHTNTLCGELTYELMRHSQVDKLIQNRSAAATCLFLMLYTNNQTVNNVLRVKLQATIAISKLVGERIDQDYDYIRGCLEAVAKHIKTNVSKIQTQQGPLSQQIDELNERLFGVIRDSLKIKHHLYDPEMTADLYNNISRGFMESPDLRVTWLNSLSNFHKEHNNWEETAQTLIMTAALVMEYLKILNRFPVRFPADFESVLPNIKKELTLPDPALLTSLQNEICLSRVFTEQGFIGLIKEAIGMQKLGLLYESSVAAYRLLLPIHQQKRNWVMQAECHMDLAHLCNKIVEDNKASARIFPNYYRVALYGQELIAASHGCEYVYKESNATRLTDLSDRLMKQFGDKFGEDKVHLLPNKPVDVKTLNPAHIYIQIVTVDPFLTTEQSKERMSTFEQNFNINSFMFEIPFTKSGKAHGDMAEQYKRKTILVIEGSFPHVKKRLKIVEKREIEVPPIENAIELIDKKAVQLGQQLRTAQPNSKTLQIILQGALLLQVNAGPLEICRVFLSDEAPKNSFSPADVAKLTATMKEFAQYLAAAVKLNAKMVDANDNNQMVLQENLVAGYKTFASKITQYVPNIDIAPEIVG